MFVSSLRLKNVKCFEDSGIVELSPKINIFIGSNNSGKSTILSSLYSLQEGSNVDQNFLRTGKDSAHIFINLEDIKNKCYFPDGPNIFQSHYKPNFFQVISKNGVSPLTFTDQGGASRTYKRSSNFKPDNFIFPYLAKRKVHSQSKDISKTSANVVTADLHLLTSKIDSLINPHHPLHEVYEEACQNVLGYKVSTAPSDNGKISGIYVTADEFIQIEHMGEGVLNLLGLIVLLIGADKKLFIIEELENDIHPKALKSILKLILKSSLNNQFVISTHSNIVVSELGIDESTKIFKVSSELVERVPTSECHEIQNTSEDRISLLEELGYDLGDYNLWKAWLFCEESSAERIIRQYLIKWFAPNLIGKLRTFSTAGVTNTKDKFDGFNNLFVFTHLESLYKNKAWVYVDNDAEGQKTLETFLKKYKTWDSKCFRCSKYENFEDYYPEAFKDKVEKIHNMNSGREKQDEKTILLNEVINWIESDQKKAEAYFEEQAEDIISLLKDIEKAIEQ